jgi:hypothetical protein
VEYRINDRVLVKSFAKSNVKVKLINRYSPKKGELGVDGWDAIIYDLRDVKKLIKDGVPYGKNEKPKVWVFDFQIIKKIS